MSNELQNSPKGKMEKLKTTLGAASIQEQFKNALKENSGSFVASIIDLYNSDTYLQQCDPNKVVMEALKAATLKLPINKQLGFAYIVPYKNKGEQIPQFQLGYRGYLQLAMRTGQYRRINAGMVPEGIEVKRDILTGDTTFIGEGKSDKAQGYFAYMELLNGFTKTVYMTKEEIERHGKKYSKSYGYDTSAWKTNFDEMATKTVIRKLLSHYGIMSIEMMSALTSDAEEEPQTQAAVDIDMNANAEVIDITPEAVSGFDD